MTRTIVMIALLTAACASEETVAVETAGAAGSVAVESEALTATCTEAQFCSAAKAKGVSYMGGGTWSWSGACGDQTWNGRGPGGRTVQVHKVTYPNPGPNNIHGWWFEPSQSNNFTVTCSCPAGGVGCSAN